MTEKGMGGLTTEDLIGIAQLPSPLSRLPSSLFRLTDLPFSLSLFTYRRLILQ